MFNNNNYYYTIKLQTQYTRVRAHTLKRHIINILRLSVLYLSHCAVINLLAV